MAKTPMTTVTPASTSPVKITASAFNTLRENVDKLMGVPNDPVNNVADDAYGWDQGGTTASERLALNKVYYKNTADLTDGFGYLLDDLQNINLFLGEILTLPTAAKGTKITASDWNATITAIDSAWTNRFSPALTQDTSNFSQTVATFVWNNEIGYNFGFDWSDADACRSFFNGGGELVVAPFAGTEVTFTYQNFYGLNTTRTSIDSGTVGGIGWEVFAKLNSATSPTLVIFETVWTATGEQTTDIAISAYARTPQSSGSGFVFEAPVSTTNGVDPYAGYFLTVPASINEGSAGTIVVNTLAAANGTTLYWTATPSGEFETASGSFTINNNEGSFTVTPSADSTTEGAETGTIQIRTGSTSGSVVASDTFTINDTSESSVTINAFRSTSSVNEGQSFTFKATASTAITGTVSFVIGGTATDGEDYNTSGASTGTTGTFTFNNSTDSNELTVATEADATTDGSTETVTCTISNPNVSGFVAGIGTSSVSVNIVDTSQTPAAPTYSLSVDPVTATVTEGESFRITLTTTNVADGTSVPYTINQVGADEVGVTTSGSFTVNSGEAFVDFSTTDDSELNGTRTFTLTLTNNEDFISVDINDNESPTATLNIVASATQVNEGQPFTFRVTSDIPITGTVDVVIGGTATGGGEDYTASGATSQFTFNNSTTSNNLTIATVADNFTDPEGTQTVTATISSPNITSGQTAIINTTSASVNILDTSQTPDLGSVNLDLQTSLLPGTSVNEGGSFNFFVQASETITGTVQVALTGSATGGGEDYTASGATSQFTFNNSTTSNNLTIATEADGTSEGTQTVTATISSPNITSGQTPNITDSSETVTINDTSLTPVTINAFRSTASVNEGGSFTFRATASRAITGTVSFVIGGTATDGVDYNTSGASTGTTGTFTFNNSTDSNTVTVATEPDATTDGSTETVTCTISNPNVSGFAPSIGTSSVSVNIVDTSLTPVTIDAFRSTSSVNEGQSFTFRATASRAITGTVSFVIGGTATDGVDYNTSGASTGTTGTFTFSNSTQSNTVTVATEADGSSDSSTETVTCTISSPSVPGFNPSIGTSSVSVNIVDTSLTPVTIDVLRSTSSVNEGGSFTFRASASRAITGTVSFSLGGTATDGSDYNTSGASTGTTGTFTFSNSTLSNTVTVATVADAFTDNRTESVTCTISSPSVPGFNPSIGTSAVVVNIVDTSLTPVSFNVSRSTGSVNEGQSFTFSATASRAVTGTVSFSLGGTATDGVDYNTSGASTGTTGTFTFSNSTSSNTVTVATVSDETGDGGTETVSCTISNPSAPGFNPSIGVATTSVSILDTSVAPPVSLPSSVSETANVTEPNTAIALFKVYGDGRINTFASGDGEVSAGRWISTRDYGFNYRVRVTGVDFTTGITSTGGEPVDGTYDPPVADGSYIAIPNTAGGSVQWSISAFTAAAGEPGFAQLDCTLEVERVGASPADTDTCGVFLVARVGNQSVTSPPPTSPPPSPPPTSPPPTTGGGGGDLDGELDKVLN